MAAHDRCVVEEINTLKGMPKHGGEEGIHQYNVELLRKHAGHRPTGQLVLCHSSTLYSRSPSMPWFTVLSIKDNMNSTRQKLFVFFSMRPYVCVDVLVEMLVCRWSG